MTDTTTATALLQAILADPDDDLPRLLFADVLEEEAGGYSPRAEFIRVQIELARRPEWDRHCKGRLWGCHPNVPCRLCWLRFRENACHPSWPSDHYTLRSVIGSDARDRGWGWSLGWSWRYDRGFAEQVECPCEEWLAWGPAVVRVQPVREVRLTDKRTQIHLRLPGGAGVRWIPARFLTPESESATIPQALCPHLPGEDRHLYERWWYNTEADAHAALSRACLTWAKSQSVPP